MLVIRANAAIKVTRASFRTEVRSCRACPARATTVHGFATRSPACAGTVGPGLRETTARNACPTSCHPTAINVGPVITGCTRSFTGANPATVTFPAHTEDAMGCAILLVVSVAVTAP